MFIPVLSNGLPFFTLRLTQLMKVSSLGTDMPHRPQPLPALGLSKQLKQKAGCIRAAPLQGQKRRSSSGFKRRRGDEVLKKPPVRRLFFSFYFLLFRHIGMD
jgi:hypothetical protein